MGIIDYACLLQDERPDLDWPEALKKATLSLTGRQKLPPGMPKTRELADRYLERLRSRSSSATTANPVAARKQDRPPEHVLRNIARVRAAELERNRTGGTLPTATFVRGGTMIKK